MSLLDSVWGLLSYDIGIDLGTANTLVAVSGQSVIISEPSVVAMNKKTKHILAVGLEAKQMIGRTPDSVIAIRPLRDGVISDFDSTKSMIKYFIEKVHKEYQKMFKIPRPRVVIGVPSAVTEVEKKAVIDAAISAGAREAFIIEEPIAAAIGAKLPVTEARGCMIVDIGGGTSDIAIISMGGIVVDKTIRIAGDEMDVDIMNYVKNKYNLLIGEKSAEESKMLIGSAYPVKENKTYKLKGRDLVTGLPKVIILTSVEVREAIMNSLNIIIDSIKEAIEECPPELLSDIYEDGVVITGGGGLIRGIDKLIAEKVKLRAVVAKDPLMSVVCGTQDVLNNIEILAKIHHASHETL